MQKHTIQHFCSMTFSRFLLFLLAAFALPSYPTALAACDPNPETRREDFRGVSLRQTPYPSTRFPPLSVFRTAAAVARVQLFCNLGFD